MEKQAISKFIRVSPYKAREVARLIQGKLVDDALAILDFTPRKSGRLIAKTLRSAVANLVNSEDAHVTKEEVFVKSATIGEGPTMKRFRPKARGMAGRIRRRTSHIKVVVETLN